MFIFLAWSQLTKCHKQYPKPNLTFFYYLVIHLILHYEQNHKDVLVVVDSEDYPALLEFLKGNQDEEQFRKKLAWKAFQHVASYDSAVSEWLWKQTSAGIVLFPVCIVIWNTVTNGLLWESGSMSCNFSNTKLFHGLRLNILNRLMILDVLLKCHSLINQKFKTF